MTRSLSPGAAKRIFTDMPGISLDGVESPEGRVTTAGCHSRHELLRPHEVLGAHGPQVPVPACSRQTTNGEAAEGLDDMPRSPFAHQDGPSLRTRGAL